MDPLKIVVVGGVAGGMSFAARARRLAEDAKIVVLERGPHVSFANCGLPYHLAGEIPDREDLLLHTPASLAASLALDVRTRSEVVAVDRVHRVVRVRPVDEHGQGLVDREYEESYDTLVLATGAAPIVPPLPGLDLPHVHVLRSVPDVDALGARLTEGARRAVVVGAGFIGLEVAEAFRHRGLEVTVVEMAPQVLAPLDPEMARSVENELRSHGVEVLLGRGLVAVHPAAQGTAAQGTAEQGTAAQGTAEQGTAGAGAVRVEVSDGTHLDADVVLLAIGVRPDSRLAAEAGLEVDERGGVVVDAHQRTSDEHVYAVGDAVQVTDAVTGGPALIPLAGPANRQGRAAADHLFGRPTQAVPVLGTAIVRVFDVVAASTGRNERALRAAGVPFRALHLHPAHHAGYYPGARALHLKVLFSPEDGRLLGAQATGREGVDKRIDVIATALRAGMRITDLADLELAYAPPFGSAKDPVNMAGFIGENLLAGDLDLWYPSELDGLAEVPQGPGAPVFLDVRTAAEHARCHLKGSLHIPHTQLRERLSEIPEGRAVRVYCASGFRSYLATRILRQNGWDDVASLSGGLTTMQLARPDTCTR